jgi:hypothetical protein
MEFTVITGLVTLMGKWLNYEKRKLAQEGQSVPQPDEETKKGEEVAQVIEAGIQQHGGIDEQTALAGFRQNPEMFASVLEQAMKNLAQREPTFAQQLQRMAERINIAQTGSLSGSRTISSENYDINIDSNTGNFTQGNIYNMLLSSILPGGPTTPPDLRLPGGPTTPPDLRLPGGPTTPSDRDD